MVCVGGGAGEEAVSAVETQRAPKIALPTRTSVAPQRQPPLRDRPTSLASTARGAPRRRRGACGARRAVSNVFFARSGSSGRRHRHETAKGQPDGSPSIASITSAISLARAPCFCTSPLTFTSIEHRAGGSRSSVVTRRPSTRASIAESIVCTALADSAMSFALFDWRWPWMKCHSMSTRSPRAASLCSRALARSSSPNARCPAAYVLANRLGRLRLGDRDELHGRRIAPRRARAASSMRRRTSPSVSAIIAASSLACHTMTSLCASSGPPWRIAKATSMTFEARCSEDALPTLRRREKLPVRERRHPGAASGSSTGSNSIDTNGALWRTRGRSRTARGCGR